MTNIKHLWDVSPANAIEVQNELSSEIRLQPLAKMPELIGGADISFNKYSEVVYAGIVVLRLSDMSEVERAGTVTTVKFPYIPGLLSFREIPALLEAWQKLTILPDVMVLDGQGIAHPRKMGIASHFGLLTGIPSIGCAKSVLVGKFEEPGMMPGDFTPLIHKKEEIGRALRTKVKVKPVFVSPGHLITPDESIQILMSCVRGYRIPEPTRIAHLLVNQLRTSKSESVTGQLPLF